MNKEDARTESSETAETALLQSDSFETISIRSDYNTNSVENLNDAAVLKFMWSR